MERLTRTAVVLSIASLGVACGRGALGQDAAANGFFDEVRRVEQLSSPFFEATSSGSSTCDDATLMRRSGSFGVPSNSTPRATTRSGISDSSTTRRDGSHTR